MNDQTPTGSATQQDELPELSQDRIDRIERAVFTEIASERTPEHIPIRKKSRRRAWLTGIGVAAAFVAGVLITPPLLNTVGVSTADSGGSVADVSESAPSNPAVSESLDSASTIAPELADGADREIIATAQATLQVIDIRDAAAAIAAIADERGGYVESTEIRTNPVEDQTSAQAPPDSGYGWISIRVPSADLTEVIEELASSGKVLSSSVSKQDVTSTAIDLRARVDATRASVERLTELMSDTATVSELIEAETALSDRQALLESYEQQLAALDDQVAMSTLQVELTRTANATSADPDGFAAGLLAGWNGLIVSLNALVVAIGFVLPWLVIAGVVVLVIWLVRRRRRTRAARQEP